MKYSTAKDCTNKKIHNLTFIEKTERKRGTNIIWKALCDCGNITYVVPADVKNENTTSCGCQHKKAMQKAGPKVAAKNRKYDPIVSSARVVWKAYKDADCNFDTFFKLSQQNCFYCGRAPHITYNVVSKKGRYNSQLQREQGNFTYNGLDRIDNTIGHTKGNIVPCCKGCNIAKNAISLDEFFTLIKLIYLNRVKHGSV